ncbi:MAG: serine/threonine protein kinase, partial [Myxococcales bacterium]|nr:serine/threonine protein kinase [Myxococcales bacterium]
MALQPGAMLTPTLRLDRELGHGAMGEVWIATNLALGSQVAVKVLRDSGMSGGESQARFQQEARGLAQLDSPHVVRIYDFGVTADDEPFIVMELLKGRDLRSHIEAVGALPLAATESIVVQVCRALSAAHARRIVHRDIKPANIFLTDAAGSVFVKVLDFGVAKFLGADLGMTTTGAIVGTPYYASPEQLLAPKDLDHRTDL